MTTLLNTALLLAALGQFCIAGINLNLIRLMGWHEDVARMQLLVREVFHVHKWFITITLVIFGTLTARFAGEMAAGALPVYRWLACAIGAFWGIRTWIQFGFYSDSHWRGMASRFLVHIVLLVTYGGFATVYLIAAFRK